MIVITARITHLGIYDAESSTIRIGLRFYASYSVGYQINQSLSHFLSLCNIIELDNF